METLFLEVDFAQRAKAGQATCGDCFMSRRVDGEERLMAVLSDGLGSGVKANILSSMTATMALKFGASNMDFLHSAEVMMDALPVCQIRRISYATFTIVDSVLNGWTRLIQMDNPSCLLVREGEVVPLPQREVCAPGWRSRKILFSEVLNRPEDRIVIFSDGITQSGMGSPAHPLGWRDEGCRDFVRDTVRRHPDISARHLATAVLGEALRKEPDGQAWDDMTCGVLYFRRPRRLLLLTGPPFERKRDAEYAGLTTGFPGTTVICGGTTADIVARELGRTVHTDLSTARSGLPPLSHMEGVDLVTEGILTLTRTQALLDAGDSARSRNPAAMLAHLLLESDIVEFVVGTRINEAHQDPSLPVELEMRRNIVRNLSSTLEEKYMKKTRIRYI